MAATLDVGRSTNAHGEVRRRHRVVRGLGRPTGWVRLGRGSETFPKILKLGRLFMTAEVIPDKLIMINRLVDK